MPESATTVGARTEHARIGKANGRRASGRVAWVEHLGDQDHLHVELGEHDFVTLADPDSGLGPGDDVAIELTNPLFFDGAGERVRRMIPELLHRLILAVADDVIAHADELTALDRRSATAITAST